MTDPTPCIVTCAITGSLPQKADNPAVPITPAEQIESAHAAFEAGATLIHLHVRQDDGSVSSSPDRFAEVQAGLRRHCPGIIVQFSTGGRSGSGRERGAHLVHRPDMASLATGSVNFPTRVYDNAPDLVQWLAAEMKRHNIRPEVEVFDLSMLFQAASMAAQGAIPGHLHVQFVMGIRNAMPADEAVFDFYVRTLERLRPGASFTGAGIGRSALTVARWSMARGGHVRTGMEDNVRLDRDTLAPSNAALVRQLVEQMPLHGRRPATVAEARDLLGLPAAA